MTANRTLVVLGTVLMLALVVVVLAQSGDSTGAVLRSPEVTRAQSEDDQARVPIATPIDEAQQLSITEPAFEERSAALVDDLHELPFALSGGAAIAGRVLDDSDRGVAGVLVRLLRGSSERRTETGGDGSFEFSSLDRGSYRLYVDPNSLSEGYLPPWRQYSARAYSGVATGLGATALRVTSSDPQQVDLRIFSAASASGRVVDTSGEPIQGVTVLLSRPGAQTHAARTEADGEFVISRVYPGRYTVSAQLGPNYPDAVASAPIPYVVDIAPGSRAFLQDLLISTAGYVLTGRVLDQEGQPLEGLTLSFHEVSGGTSSNHFVAETDELGRFRVGRFPAVALRVVVDEGERRKHRGDVRLSEPVELLEVNVGGPTGELDLGEFRVECASWFVLQGTIRVDPLWATSSDFEDWTVRASLLFGGKDSRREELRVWEQLERREPASPGVAEPLRVASFEWGTASRLAPAKLELLLISERGDVKRKSIEVAPGVNETRELSIEFP